MTPIIPDQCLCWLGLTRVRIQTLPSRGMPKFLLQRGKWEAAFAGNIYYHTVCRCHLVATVIHCIWCVNIFSSLKHSGARVHISTQCWRIFLLTAVEIRRSKEYISINGFISLSARVRDKGLLLEIRSIAGSLKTTCNSNSEPSLNHNLSLKEPVINSNKWI